MLLSKCYADLKKKLLSDNSICSENRRLFNEFFEFEERKLKRQNGLSSLDDGCYKTLCYYVLRFRNVNTWFKNKPWIKLGKFDIQKVYDDLEDGKIVNRFGKRYEDRSSYYSKVFKSKPFALAGKVDIAREVMEYHTDNVKKEVRFVTEETLGPG